MSLWDKAKAAAEACKYGQKLENSANWKDKAIIGNIFASLLACAAPFVPELQALSPDALRDYGLYLGWGAYAVFNLYVHIATSDQVGIGASNNTPLQRDK